MQHFTHKEPAVQEFIASLAPDLQAVIAEIYAKAHVQGVWELIYDPEANEPVWPLAVAAMFNALQNSGTYFNVANDCTYLTGWWGKGWVIWGEGCSGASAALALHMDESHTDYIMGEL